MAASIQVKRGVTAKVAAYTPLNGELVLDTTTFKLYAGNGTTAGGKQIVGSNVGVTSGTDALAGEIGEYATSSGTNVAQTSNSASNVASILLTPGDWQVDAVVQFTPDTTTTISALAIGLSTTAGAFPGYADTSQQRVNFPAGLTQVMSCPMVRLNISANATVYLVSVPTFSTSTLTASATIKARRVR